MAEEPYIDLITGKPVEQWVADAMARPSKRAMAEDITRPIIGIEIRTAQEVFDIMCDRIRSDARHRTEAVKPLVEALENIVAPLAMLQREAEARGNRLSGAAYSIANDLGFVQKIARDALEAFRSEQL